MANIKVIQLINQYPNYYYYSIESNIFSSQAALKRIYIPDNVYNSSTNWNVFSTLHEIGHCETYMNKQCKPLREFLSTQWAINHSKKYNITLSDDDKNVWQEYIYSFTKSKSKDKYKLNWNSMYT